MSQRSRGKIEPKSSIESMIKEAIISLSESPGSTLNSISEHIKGNSAKFLKSEVLEGMKKMRKTGMIIQIKCYFRLPHKELNQEIRRRKAKAKFAIAQLNSTIEGRVKEEVLESNFKRKNGNSKKVKGKIKKRIFKLAPNIRRHKRRA